MAQARNAPCGCGSGLKYKRCHLEWDRQGITPDRPNAQTQPAGSIAGYNVVLLGERPNPTALQIWPTPGGSIKTNSPMEVFDARVGGFSLDSIVSLAANLTRRFWKDRAAFDRDLRRANLLPSAIFLPALIRRLVTDAIARRSLPDTATQEIGADWFAKAERVLQDATSVSDHALIGGFGAESTAMRALQAQYHDQLDYDTFIRELWLCIDTVNRCQTAGIDLNDGFLQAFGLSYFELAVLSFAAWSTVIEGNGVIDPATWHRADFIKIAPAQFDAFFKLCGIDYEQLKKEAADPAYSEPGFEPYAFSPLISSPLVRRSNGTYVVPVARDVLERPTRSFPIDALRALETMPGRAKGVFADQAGQAFESYVQRSLESAAGAGVVRRGSDLHGPNQSNCDFACIEPIGVTLVEAKSRRLKLRADMTKRRDLLILEMRDKDLGHGLAQIQNTADRISAGDTDLTAETSKIGLLVVRGDLVWVNSNLFRSILEELAEEELGKPITVPYQVTNDEGFSYLIRWLTVGGPLHEFLVRKNSELQLSREDMHHTVVRERRNLPPHPLRAEQHAALDGLFARFLP